jgi:hypothetical protein
MLGVVTPQLLSVFMAEVMASIGDFLKHPDEDNTAPTRFTRILNSSANGAIVGVETSADKQLHLNAVINSKNKLLVSPFEAVAWRVLAIF